LRERGLVNLAVPAASAPIESHSKSITGWVGAWSLGARRSSAGRGVALRQRDLSSGRRWARGRARWHARRTYGASRTAAPPPAGRSAPCDASGLGAWPSPSQQQLRVCGTNSTLAPWRGRAGTNCPAGGTATPCRARGRARPDQAGRAAVLRRQLPGALARTLQLLTTPGLWLLALAMHLRGLLVRSAPPFPFPRHRQCHEAQAQG